MENHELTEEEIDEIQETFYEVKSSYYQPWERVVLRYFFIIISDKLSQQLQSNNYSLPIIA